MNMAATLPRIILGQLAHQHTAIARVLAGDPDPRDRSRIPTAAEGRDVPCSSAATDVHATDERIVGQALRFAQLCFLDAFAVDELELVGGGREAADTDANEVAVDAVGLDPLRQQFLVGPLEVSRVGCRYENAGFGLRMGRTSKSSAHESMAGGWRL